LGTAKTRHRSEPAPCGESPDGILADCMGDLGVVSHTNSPEGLRQGMLQNKSTHIQEWPFYGSSFWSSEICLTYWTSWVAVSECAPTHNSACIRLALWPFWHAYMFDWGLACGLDNHVLQALHQAISSTVLCTMWEGCELIFPSFILIRILAC